MVQAALADPDARDYVLYEAITDEESDAIGARTLSVVDLRGYSRSLGAGEVNKVLSKHSKDHKPIVAADFDSLPSRLANPHAQWWEQRAHGPQVLISLVRDAAGALRVVEEQRTGRRQLAFISMYRP